MLGGGGGMVAPWQLVETAAEWETTVPSWRFHISKRETTSPLEAVVRVQFV